MRCHSAVGEVVNIGSNSEISIKELTLSIKKLMNSDTVDRTEEERLRPAKSGVEQLRCDNTKIKNLVNYQPGYTLEKGLNETIAWFRKNLAKYKVNIYNV